MNQHYEYNDKKNLHHSPRRAPDNYSPYRPVVPPAQKEPDRSRTGPETSAQIMQQQKQQVQQQRNIQTSLDESLNEAADQEQYSLPGQHGQKGRPQAATWTDGVVQQQGSYERKNELAREETELQWMQKIDAAKRKWSKLTEEELVKSGGQVFTLKALVRDRYTTSHADAYKQVNDFFQSCVV